MNNSNIIIVRRVPTFQFAIRTMRTVEENAVVLENFLRQQRPPHGFVIQDPRLAGQVFGSTFVLRQCGAWMWTRNPPVIEGEFVPNENGSDVLVEVGQSRASMFVAAAFLVLVGVSLVAEGSMSMETILFLSAAILVSLLVMVLPVGVVGTQAVRTLSRVFLADA